MELLPQRSLESHPQVEDLKVHPLGHAQAERVSLAVARDNSGYRSVPVLGRMPSITFME
jgi:hypothetical protein